MGDGGSAMALDAVPWRPRCRVGPWWSRANTLDRDPEPAFRHDIGRRRGVGSAQQNAHRSGAVRWRRSGPPRGRARRMGRMYAVILAGGGGTRLWPLSRPERPKPFLPLLGGETLLRRTALRVAPLTDWEGIHVVAEARHLALVREQLPEVPERNLLGEPVGRNTAAAVAWAAEAIERPGDDVMAVLPADHHVALEGVFRDDLAAAEHLARGGEPAGAAPLVTLGIQPGGPETGYGYIVPDPASRREVATPTARVTAHRVERFVEKPDAVRAAELLATGGTTWNAGIFVGRRDTFRALLARHAADIAGPIRAAAGDPARLAAAYPGLRATSFDFAVAEPASAEGALAVIGMEVGWSDLGSWAALLDLRTAGEGSVVRDGAAEDLGSQRILVHSAGGRTVVTVGLRDTIVVDTPEVVLVCARDAAQDVKLVRQRLEGAHGGQPKEPQS